MLRWQCSQSMSKMIYCFIHMCIGWDGLSKPTNGCSVYMPIMFVNSKGAKLHSVPYVGGYSYPHSC